MDEKDSSASLRSHMTAAGADVVKRHGTTLNNGVPDLLIVSRTGVLTLVETKAEPRRKVATNADVVGLLRTGRQGSMQQIRMLGWGLRRCRRIYVAVADSDCDDVETLLWCVVDAAMLADRRLIGDATSWISTADVVRRVLELS